MFGMLIVDTIGNTILGRVVHCGHRIGLRS